jgi:hypothetical protein
MSATPAPALPHGAWHAYCKHRGSAAGGTGDETYLSRTHAASAPRRASHALTRPMSNARITVTCTACSHPFTLTARGVAARQARYGPDRLLCQRCLSALWLRGRGRGLAYRLLQEEHATSGVPAPRGSSCASEGSSYASAEEA